MASLLSEPITSRAHVIGALSRGLNVDMRVSTAVGQAVLQRWNTALFQGG